MGTISLTYPASFLGFPGLFQEAYCSILAGRLRGGHYYIWTFRAARYTHGHQCSTSCRQFIQQRISLRPFICGGDYVLFFVESG